MVNLKEEGLYIANGKDTCVLVKVVGKAPMLDIVCGVLLNDMNNNNVVTSLDKNSQEIKDIIAHPDNYVFEYPTVSTAIINEPGKNKPHPRQVEFTEKQFTKWIEEYQKMKVNYPDNYDSKMTIFLINKENFSVSQSEMIIKQINTRIRLRNLGI